MEGILSSIFEGCKLANDLESNLQNLTNHPTLLASACADIVRAFTSAIDRLNAHNPPPPPFPFRDSQASRPPELDAASIQEWLRSSYPQAMDLLQAQLFGDKSPFDLRVLPESKMGSTEVAAPVLGLDVQVTSSDFKALELDVGEAEGSTRSKGGGEFPAAEGSDSGKSPVVQRSRKRKGGGEKYTVRVAAPRTGNTEIPPDDGFTWRKYGQKEILGSMYPRSYYRCTHKSFYGCDAKKQVQRLDNDPHTFEVTYYGNHACLMSSTAPSVPPLATVEQDLLEATKRAISASLPLSRSLSMDLPRTRAGSSTTSVDPRLRMYRSFDMGGGESSSGAASEPAGSSQAREGKEVECPVVDLADAMFNSGSSSNSMDAIFPSTHDK